MSVEYNDILHLPHHVSSCRPQMSMRDRAAQFSPFAALTGYDSAISETARLTDRRIELSEDAQEYLDRKLKWIRENLTSHPSVTITYFVPDLYKDGGSYASHTGQVQYVDDVARVVGMVDGTSIPLDDIFNFSGAIPDDE